MLTPLQAAHYGMLAYADVCRVLTYAGAAAGGSFFLKYMVAPLLVLFAEPLVLSLLALLVQKQKY